MPWFKCWMIVHINLSTYIYICVPFILRKRLSWNKCIYIDIWIPTFKAIILASLWSHCSVCKHLSKSLKSSLDESKQWKYFQFCLLQWYRKAKNFFPTEKNFWENASWAKYLPCVTENLKSNLYIVSSIVTIAKLNLKSWIPYIPTRE